MATGTPHLDNFVTSIDALPYSLDSALLLTKVDWSNPTLEQLDNWGTLEQLDAFHECQLTAAGRTLRLPPIFYTLKYSRKRNSALKGFARDCLVAFSELYQLAVSRPVRRDPRDFVCYAPC